MTPRKARGGVGYNCPGFSHSGWRSFHRHPMPPSATWPPTRTFHAGSAETRRASRFFEAFHRAFVSRRRRRGAGRDRRQRHAARPRCLRMLAGLSRARVRRNPAGRANGSGPSIPSCARRSRSADTCPSLKDELTAEENLASLVALEGTATVARGPRATRSTRSRLSRQRALPARVLSQGQRRRIGLARLSLVCAPAVDPGRAAGRARCRRCASCCAHPRRATSRTADSRSSRPTRRSASPNRASSSLVLD